MDKKIILALLIPIFLISFSSAVQNWTYVEDSDNYYAFTNNYWGGFGLSVALNGVWGLGNTYTCAIPSGYILLNYTIPSDTADVLWQFQVNQDSGGNMVANTTNITVTSDCINYALTNGNLLQLQFSDYNSGGGCIDSFSCYNGTDWNYLLLDQSFLGTGFLIEEAILYRPAEPLPPVVIQPQDTSIGDALGSSGTGLARLLFYIAVPLLILLLILVLIFVIQSIMVNIVDVLRKK